MPNPKSNVLIYDDFEAHDQQGVGELIPDMVSELGFEPHTFETVNLGLEYVADNHLTIGATVCLLDREGSRNRAGGRDPLGMPILKLARHHAIPTALMSDYTGATDYVTDTPNGIVLPGKSLEHITPTLNTWFQKLIRLNS